jgi:putative hydrolase of the HAD superfamily
MPAPDFTDVRVVFFDLDDTLCAYWDASKAALRTAFESFPVAGNTTDEMRRHWAAAFRNFGSDLKATGWYDTYLLIGEPTRTEQMRLTLERVGINDPDHAAALSEAYMTHRDRNLRLFDDALHVITTLKNKFGLGMITNGPADIQRQEVNTLGLAPYFDHIFIEGEMGMGKPKKEVFDRARAAFGAEPQECLMVGNSFGHDITPAIEYGWHTAWIRRPSDVPPSATDEGTVEEAPVGAPEPCIVIRELSELLPLLSR